MSHVVFRLTYRNLNCETATTRFSKPYVGKFDLETVHKRNDNNNLSIVSRFKTM